LSMIRPPGRRSAPSTSTDRSCRGRQRYAVRVSSSRLGELGAVRPRLRDFLAASPRPPGRRPRAESESASSPSSAHRPSSAPTERGERGGPLRGPRSLLGRSGWIPFAALLVADDRRRLDPPRPPPRSFQLSLNIASLLTLAAAHGSCSHSSSGVAESAFRHLVGSAMGTLRVVLASSG